MSDFAETNALLAALEGNDERIASILDDMTKSERIELGAAAYRLVTLAKACRFCSKTVIGDENEVAYEGFHLGAPRVHAACLQAQGGHVTPSGEVVPEHTFRPGYGDQVATCRTCHEEHR